MRKLLPFALAAASLAAMATFSPAQIKSLTLEEMIDVSDDSVLSISRDTDNVTGLNESVINGDPLEDVAAVQGPAGVMVRGTWLSEAEIAEGLEALTGS